jgi:hypothetical protein
LSEDKGSKLNENFSEHVDQLTDIEYRHPEAEIILEKLHEIFAQSPTAEHLHHVIEQYNIPFYIIQNKDIQGFTPDKKTIFVSLPSIQDKPVARFVLESVAAMREIEQEIIGYKRPPVDADPLEFAAISHAKNLDIIYHMCKTAHELSGGSENSQYIQSLEEMGHGGLYDAYIRDFAADDMVDVYYKS